jgi:hypothetical protein
MEEILQQLLRASAMQTMAEADAKYGAVSQQLQASSYARARAKVVPQDVVTEAQVYDQGRAAEFADRRTAARTDPTGSAGGDELYATTQALSRGESTPDMYAGFLPEEIMGSVAKAQGKIANRNAYFGDVMQEREHEQMLSRVGNRVADEQGLPRGSIMFPELAPAARGPDPYEQALPAQPAFTPFPMGVPATEHRAFAELAEQLQRQREALGGEPSWYPGPAI